MEHIIDNLTSQFFGTIMNEKGFIHFGYYKVIWHLEGVMITNSFELIGKMGNGIFNVAPKETSNKCTDSVFIEDGNKAIKKINENLSGLLKNIELVLESFGEEFVNTNANNIYEHIKPILFTVFEGFNCYKNDWNYEVDSVIDGIWESMTPKTVKEPILGEFDELKIYVSEMKMVIQVRDNIEQGKFVNRSALSLQNNKLEKIIESVNNILIEACMVNVNKYMNFMIEHFGKEFMKDNFYEYMEDDEEDKNEDIDDEDDDEDDNDEDI